ASSAEASPGGQISRAGAAALVEMPVARETPIGPAGALVEGARIESRLGSVTSDMIFVTAAEIANVALGAGASPVVLDPVVLVVVVVVVGLVGADKLGKGIAPEVAVGAVPGGGGGGPVVVVARVEGDVEVVPVVAVEVEDCASVGLANATRTAAASA